MTTDGAPRGRNADGSKAKPFCVGNVNACLQQLAILEHRILCHPSRKLASKRRAALPSLP